MYIVLSYPTKSTTLTSTDIGSQKSLKKWNRTPKGSSKFCNVIVYLFVDTYVPIVYRVMSSSTKSTTLTLTDIGSLQKFSKWNRTPKGSSNFGNVRAYLFVSTIITIVYRVLSSQPKVRLSHQPTSVPQNFSKKMEPNAERLVKILRCDSLPFR
jgi:hypothetical protein